MRKRVALAVLALAAGVAAVIVAIVVAQSALADGDPASDILIGNQVFLPYSESVPSAPAQMLAHLLADSKKKGFPLKVAVIARRNDLGSVPSLYGKPQEYASFLGQEDYFFWKDELLVVMPQGYGLYKHANLPRADEAIVAGLAKPAAADGSTLTLAAIAAVRKLAEGHGLTLSAGSESSATTDRVEIFAGVLALCALALGVRLVLRRR